MMPSSSIPLRLRQRASPPSGPRAFTLVEMIIVLTIMVIAIGIAAPSFHAFMAGRNVDNEAQRFLSLTRFGSSRAIAEGLPVDLGINLKQNRYWLAACGGYTESHTNVVAFVLDKDVQMMVNPAPGTLTTQSNVWTPSVLFRGSGVPIIRFQPDGFISDTSPQIIKFRQPTGSDPETWIVQNADHRRYDLEPGHPRKGR
ncbi:MAG: GspH/FimT family pseudopilin [Verrucomicrobiota bacterium]|jgi:type II secretion system protein H